jgi:hypothetical protein
MKQGTCSCFGTQQRLMFVQSEDRTVRLASASFLSSFLARYTRLTPAAVVNTLRRLAAFALNYSRTHAPLLRPPSNPQLPPHLGKVASLPSLRRSLSPHRSGALMTALTSSGIVSTDSGGGSSLVVHEVFFAACQAILYSLCYQMGAVDMGGEAVGSHDPSNLVDFVRSEVIELLHSPLEPLKACLPSVANEFLRQVAALGVSDVSALLQLEFTDHRTPAKRPFDMFFPFDPYLLPLSLPLLCLDNCYRKWHNGQVIACVPSSPASNPPQTPTSSSGLSSASEDPSGHLQRASPSIRDEDTTVHSRPSGNANPFAVPQRSTAPSQLAQLGFRASSPSDHGFMHGASYASSPGGPRLGTSTPRGGAAMSLSDPIDCMDARRREGAPGMLGKSRLMACGASTGDEVMGCTPDAKQHQFW